MSSLSVAIIGAGNIAGGYDQNRRQGDGGVYSHAGAYAVGGKFVLQTVFDVDLQRAESFGSYWNVHTVVPELTDICSGFHDVVSVCAPDETHYEVIMKLLECRCCRTIFVEKPVAAGAAEIEQLDQLAGAVGINVIANFQRRNEPIHQAIRDWIHSKPDWLLSVSSYYIKGLRHIGITMVDTLTFLFGYPEAVLAYHRVFNHQVGDYSYEFVLYFAKFNVVVKTTDAERFEYNYHIFEIDLLFADRRLTIMDNSRLVREVGLGDYAYSGVKVFDDSSPVCTETGLSQAMVNAAEYVYEVTVGLIPHRTNTLADSYNNALIVERIVESFNLGSAKLDFERGIWKR